MPGQFSNEELRMQTEVTGQIGTQFWFLKTNKKMLVLKAHAEASSTCRSKLLADRRLLKAGLKKGCVVVGLVEPTLGGEG